MQEGKLLTYEGDPIKTVNEAEKVLGRDRIAAS